MKRIIALIILLCVIFCLCAPCTFAATPSMTLWGLNTPTGESSLIKSGNEFLLIDAAREENGADLVKLLEKLQVKNLSIYISHIHPDHIGGVSAVAEKYKINKLYLPDSSIAAEQPYIESQINGLIRESGAEDKNVVFLKRGSTFSFGNVQCKILGPCGSYTVSQFDGNTEKRLNHYVNNYSLTALFTCGNIKYLSCGDIEIEEEKALLKQYGNGLKADILKLSHHGLNTSNTEEFLNAVNPDYSYALNSEYTYIAEGVNVRATYTARRIASQHGFVYTVGEENKNFCADVNGNTVKIYRDNKDGTALDGWVTVFGNDGVHEKYDKYYFKNGITVKGVSKIGSKYYYLGKGGCMEKGNYLSGSYSPWRDYSDEYGLPKKKKLRAFKQTGEMYVGFNKVDGYNYYFEPATGFRKLGNKNWTPVKIGKYKYALNANGVVYNGGWKKYGSKLRYFDKNGKMKTGWFTLSKKTYYMNKSTGYRTVGLKKISGKTYYFVEKNKAAYRYSGWKSFGKKKRYFDKKGVMAVGKKKIGGKVYRFNKKGYKI